MAQQDSLYDNVQGALRQRTHLLQLYVDDPEQAPREISLDNKHGVPIMCIVNPSSCWCTCKRNLPNGMFTLEQNWGKANKTISEPGYKCCYNNISNTVAVMITKNTIRFRCPITHIPTKDNVRVSMDIGVNFHIGMAEEDPNFTKEKQHDDVKKFFYNFGPNRLEELLSEEIDEAIRNFTKKIKVSRVRDIKIELTQSMHQDLQKSFSDYGVYIEQVNIMNVIMPRDLREFLMHTTNYDVYLQKQVKEQGYKMLRLNNDENKKLL